MDSLSHGDHENAPRKHDPNFTPHCSQPKQPPAPADDTSTANPDSSDSRGVSFAEPPATPATATTATLGVITADDFSGDDMGFAMPGLFLGMVVDESDDESIGLPALLPPAGLGEEDDASLSASEDELHWAKPTSRAVPSGTNGVLADNIPSSAVWHTDHGGSSPSLFGSSGDATSHSDPQADHPKVELGQDL